MIRWLMMLAIVALAGVACASDASVTTTLRTEDSTTVDDAATTPEVTTTAVTTTAAPGAAPPELAGQWETVLDTGDPQMDRVFMSFTGTNYSVSRGPNSASGAILVEGDRITFSDASACPGIGLYQWSVEGDSLTFTMLDPSDECGGRSPILDGITYTR